MSRKGTLALAWGSLYVICMVFGFIETQNGLLQAIFALFSIGFFVLGKKSGVAFSFDSYGYLRFNKDGVEHCVKADEIEKVKFWPMTMASIEFEISRAMTVSIP